MIDVSLNEPVRDSEDQHPVAGVWRGPLREIVRAFAKGDFGLKNGIAGVEPINAETADEIRGAILAYGATLAELPEETWDTSVSQWYGLRWDVLVDLWTVEEGRSDLALHCLIRSHDDGYRIAVHSVYVP